MLDERVLARALARPAKEQSAAAIDEIMHLAQSAKYHRAAERAAELLEAGCKDVRAFIVYALAVFAERGPGSIPALFDPITAVLSTRAPGFGSAPRAADTALRFGFRTLKAQLEFDERKTGAARQPWSRHYGSSSAVSVQRACSDLRVAIQEAIENPRCEAELGNVVARLEAYAGRFTSETQQGGPVRLETAAAVTSEVAAAPAESSLPSVEPAEPASAEPEFDAAESEPAQSADPAGFARRASNRPADEATLTISPALRQFLRKLEAFELLVQSGSLAKAAVVAHDIRQVVANFDPMTYLPDLLSPHFRLLTGNVERLSPYWEESATPSWQALEQLYRVDLDAFIDA